VAKAGIDTPKWLGMTRTPLVDHADRVEHFVWGRTLQTPQNLAGIFDAVLRVLSHSEEPTQR
jgi:hypothetical protein